MKKLLILFSFLFLTISNVHAVDITQKIGGSNIGANSYFSATRQGNSYAFELGYFYNTSNSSDNEFVDKYNLRTAISGNNNNPNKTMFYFVMSYCSNVGASITSIANTNYNFIDLNFNTYTSCTVNNGSQYYTATLWNMYFRMSPTSTNVGNSSYEAIIFANTINVASQFSYNGYVGFNSLSILTRDEYESYLQSQKELNNQNTIINNQQSIINGQNTINNSVNNVTNTINDSNVDNPSNDISSFNQYLATNSTISSLLLLPVSLYQKILNSINASCTSYDAGEFLGTHLVFPCINISNYIGNTLWSVIDVLISGIFVYNISRHFIKVFDTMSSMKDGDIIDD